jgi:hypothetical protein
MTKAEKIRDWGKRFRIALDLVELYVPAGEQLKQDVLREINELKGFIEWAIDHYIDYAEERGITDANTEKTRDIG